jgi:cell division protein FtsQ
VVKKRISKTKKLIVAVLLVATISTAAYLLGWSAVFTVKHINVLGAPTSVEANIVEQTSQIALGEKMARLEPRVVSSLLQKVIWLDHSTVTRDWFNGSIVIRVWQRVPVATFQGQLIDATGNIFILPNFVSTKMPVIFAKDHTSAHFAITLMIALPPKLRSALVGIAVVGLNSATLSLKDSSQGSGKVLEVAWGDASNMDLKVKVYQALIALPENAHISAIDLSAPHAPIVK